MFVLKRCDKGEINMKVKIVNGRKFIRSISIIFLLILGISLLISNKSFSHGESNYKTIYVSGGDTLWSIAREEKASNTYYEDKDLRYIIDDIKEINNIKTSDLKVNQTLRIKEI